MDLKGINIIEFLLSFILDILFINVFFVMVLIFLSNILLLFFLLIIVRRKERLATKILYLLEQDSIHSSLFGGFILNHARSIFNINSSKTAEFSSDKNRNLFWANSKVYSSKIFLVLEKTQLILKSKIFFRFK